MVLQFQTDWQNAVILKSGFSTLGNLIYNENTGKWLNKNHTVFNMIYYNHLYFTNLDPEKKLFIVWRDPYDRIISLYKDLVTNKQGQDGFLTGTNLSYDNIENQKDEFIKVCLLKNNNHVKIIKHQIGNKINCIDCIVPINKLDKFIKEELKHDYYIPNNISRKDIDVSYFEKYRDIIREEYKEDYELLEMYKDKIYE